MVGFVALLAAEVQTYHQTATLVNLASDAAALTGCVLFVILTTLVLILFTGLVGSLRRTFKEYFI